MERPIPCWLYNTHVICFTRYKKRKLHSQAECWLIFSGAPHSTFWVKTTSYYLPFIFYFFLCLFRDSGIEHPILPKSDMKEETSCYILNFGNSPKKCVWRDIKYICRALTVRSDKTQGPGISTFLTDRGQLWASICPKPDRSSCMTLGNYLTFHSCLLICKVRGWRSNKKLDAAVYRQVHSLHTVATQWLLIPPFLYLLSDAQVPCLLIIAALDISNCSVSENPLQFLLVRGLQLLFI